MKRTRPENEVQTSNNRQLHEQRGRTRAPYMSVRPET